MNKKETELKNLTKLQEASSLMSSIKLMLVSIRERGELLINLLNFPFFILEMRTPMQIQVEI
jgi:hypothetical protein